MDKMDDKLKWCFGKKEVKLQEPNENLALEYIKNAEETMIILQKVNESNMWLATTKYYAEYFAAYALLMRIGIKSEIHDCTIEIIKFLEDEKVIKKGFSKLLDDDKKLRIENQYYLKNRKVLVEYNKLRDLILEIKEKINTITNEDVEKIRRKIVQIIKGFPKD